MRGSREGSAGYDQHGVRLSKDGNEVRDSFGEFRLDSFGDCRLYGSADGSGGMLQNGGARENRS
jgi:hypothetical protein